MPQQTKNKEETKQLNAQNCTLLAHLSLLVEGKRASERSNERNNSSGSQGVVELGRSETQNDTENKLRRPMAAENLITKLKLKFHIIHQIGKNSFPPSSVCSWQSSQPASQSSSYPASQPVSHDF